MDSLSDVIKTTVCQSPPADSIPKLVSYIMHLRNLRKRHKYQPPNVIAMDETAYWMDMPSDTTVDSVGARSIPIKTTGHTISLYRNPYCSIRWDEAKAICGV